MSPATLQDYSSVGSFFNVAETETLVLFEHLSLKFLEEFDGSPRLYRGEHENTNH
jgi:hypothetical protein